MPSKLNVGIFVHNACKHHPISQEDSVSVLQARAPQQTRYAGRIYLELMRVHLPLQKTTVYVGMDG